MHIAEALNESVGDSGSEGDISEMEYSPSESDSDPGISSHCIGMKFKIFVLIIARFHYFSKNIVTGMLYFTEQLIITTLHYVGWSLHKQILLSLELLASPSSGPSSKRKRNSWIAIPDSALGWSFLDQKPSLPQFSEQSGSIAAVDDSSALLDFFFVFSSQYL